MATFTVTVRRASGGVAQEVVEAATRDECIAEMAKTGHVVLKIQTGEGNANPAKPVSRVKPLIGISAFALILGVGCLMAFLRDGQGHKTGAVASPGKSTSAIHASRPRQGKDPKLSSVPTRPSSFANSGAAAPLAATAPNLSTFEQSLTNAYKAAKERKIIFIPNRRRTERIFEERSDRQIQRLLTLVPGRIFLSAEKYDHFTEDFRKSLRTPIAVNPEDSDEVRNIKEAVIATRRDLEKRLNAGEDIAKVMADTEAELKRMGQYRFNLETEIRKARSEGRFGEQDMRDYVEAANQMLKENNLPELRFPELWYRNAKIQEARKTEKEKTK